MGTFSRYNDSLYLAIKMAENMVDQEKMDDIAMMKELDDNAAAWVEQNDSIVREMNELKDEVEQWQQTVEEQDPFFIPFIIAGIAKALAVKVALAAKAAKIAAIAAKAGKGVAAIAKAAKVAKAAKMAKMAAKAAKWGKKAWKIARKSH